MIILFPGLGTVFFFMFATTPLPKKNVHENYLQSQEKFLLWENNEKDIVKDNLQDYFQYSSIICLNPVLKNNHIKCIEDNTAFFQESLELIKKAKQFIFIHSFIYCKKSFISSIIFTELIKKVREGVSVYLFYDW